MSVTVWSYHLCWYIGSISLFLQPYGIFPPFHTSFMMSSILNYMTATKLQSITIQTCPDKVIPIRELEVEAALRKMKNGKEAGKDQINIETLKAREETIAKQLAMLYTKCITERSIPKTWKEANMMIFVSRKGT